MPEVTPVMNVGLGTPFEAQIRFLRRKLALPTERWDDIQKSAHDKYFIVAGAQEADLLNDLHQAVAEAAASGKGQREFNRRFQEVVAKHGWSGWTGQGTPEGEAWRMRTIYQTNMATSYAAARWQQLTDPDMLRLNPYWRYVHSDSVMHPRPHHLAWDGLTLPHDHSFWRTHFAPNGWGCRCRIVAVSRSEYEKSRQAGKVTPPEGWDKIDPKTGAPVGIDRGFDYAPGANVHRSLRDFIDAKLLKLDAPIGARMWQVLAPALQAERLLAWQALVDQAAASMQATNTAIPVHTIAPDVVAKLTGAGVVLENAAVLMRDTELIHALRDSKVARGAALSADFWRQLPERLPSAAVYLDTTDNSLVYAVELDGKVGKVLVRINFNEKIRLDATRDRVVSNFVRTGGLVEASDLSGGTRYVLLKS